jgi:hypothetical protein
MPGSWPQRELPNLTADNCEITSPATPSYNCIAWAAGNNTQWWDPNGLYYWPPGVPREVTIDAVVQVYERLGFTICLSGELEPGLEKIAVFAKQSGTRRMPTHAAKQLDSGNWTSKLGPFEDISHPNLDAVNGPVYGEVLYYMSRPKQLPPTQAS